MINFDANVLYSNGNIIIYMNNSYGTIHKKQITCS